MKREKEVVQRKALICDVIPNQVNLGIGTFSEIQYKLP